MKNSIALLSIVALGVSGCGQSAEKSSLTPDQTYQAYNQRVIDGLSFDESKDYHSQAMNKKVEAQINQMKGAGGDAFEQTISVYLQMIQSSAKCNELTLASETVEGETAYLVYDRKDICNEGKVTSGGEKIRMVNERGWKIDDNLSVYNAD